MKQVCLRYMCSLLFYQKTKQLSMLTAFLPKDSHDGVSLMRSYFEQRNQDLFSHNKDEVTLIPLVYYWVELEPRMSDAT